MTTNVKNISSSLRAANQNIDFSDVETTANEAINNFNATKKTILGSVSGEIKGGIESLTQTIDGAEEALTSKLVPNIGRVTSQVPNIGSKLIGAVGGAASDITSLTGSAAAAANGFLEDIITATTPEAINASLGSAVGATTSELKPTLQSVTQDDLSFNVTDAISRTPWNSLLSSVSTFTTRLEDQLGKNSEKFLVDFGEKLERNFSNNTISIFDRPPSRGDINEAFRLVANGDYDQAFDNLSKFVDTPDNYEFIVNNLPQSQWPAEVIEAAESLNDKRARFNNLRVEISSYTNTYAAANNAAGFNTLPVGEVGAPPFQREGFTGSSIFRGASTEGDTWSFEYINSQDELDALFRNVNRSENKLIAGATIHWTATFKNQDVDAEWLHGVHKTVGFTGIGYHLVIRRDGSLQRGRPLNRTGAHDRPNNQTFLGFAFVGGINANSSSARKPYWKYASSESLTPAQFKTYDMLMETFHNVFPYAQVAGHYMTTKEGKQDPGFDVPAYSLSKFGHRNVIPELDPIWSASTPITLDTIAQYTQ